MAVAVGDRQPLDGDGRRRVVGGVARETGAAYGGVLYVDSLSEEGGPVPTYLDLLRVTVQTVADGLAPPTAKAE